METFDLLDFVNLMTNCDNYVLLYVLVEKYPHKEINLFMLLLEKQPKLLSVIAKKHYASNLSEFYLILLSQSFLLLQRLGLILFEIDLNKNQLSS